MTGATLLRLWHREGKWIEFSISMVLKCPLEAFGVLQGCYNDHSFLKKKEGGVAVDLPINSLGLGYRRIFKNKAID